MVFSREDGSKDEITEMMRLDEDMEEGEK